MDPVISAIIPVYNPGERLEKMLDCLLRQSFGAFEVILVDDGSRDSSPALCDAIAREDPRFRVVHQENRGVSAARNAGMALARGEYLTFLDGDDEIDDTYFAVLLDACRDADLSICDVVVWSGGKMTRCFTSACGTLSRQEAVDMLLTRKAVNSGPCAKLFRRGVVGAVRFQPLQAYEDILFCLDVFQRADRVTITNKTRYHYISNDQGAMSRMMKCPSTDVIAATEQIIQYLLCHEQSPECLYTTVSHLLQYAWGLVEKETRVETERCFLHQTRALFRRYRKQIMGCSAVPRKEKVVFWLFSLGVGYHNRKFVRI